MQHSLALVGFPLRSVRNAHVSIPKFTGKKWRRLGGTCSRLEVQCSSQSVATTNIPSASETDALRQDTAVAQAICRRKDFTFDS